MKEPSGVNGDRRENRRITPSRLLIVFAIILAGMALYYLSTFENEEIQRLSQPKTLNNPIERTIDHDRTNSTHDSTMDNLVTESKPQSLATAEETIAVFCQESDGRPSQEGLRFIASYEGAHVLQEGEVGQDGWISIQLPIPSELQLEFPDRSFSKSISVDDRSRNYVVVLPLVSQFELLVVDQKDREVEEAEVWTMSLTDATPRARLLGRTDANGVCRIRIVGDRVQILARHSERGISDAIDLSQLSHSNPRIRLNSATTTAWITVENEGQAANLDNLRLPMRVTVRPAKSMSGFGDGASPFALPPMQIDQDLVAIVPKDAMLWVVELRARDQVVASSSFRAVSEQEEVRLIFQEPRSLRIAIENPERERLAGLSVFAYAPESKKAIAKGHSNFKGELELLLPSRLSSVRLSITSSKWGRAQVIKSLGNLVQDELTIVVPQTKRLFRGRVVDKSSQPLPGARVAILGPKEQNYRYVAIADANGKFQLADIPEAPFTLAVRRNAKIRNSQETLFTINVLSPSSRDFVVETRSKTNGSVTFAIVSDFPRHFHHVRIENTETGDRDRFLVAHGQDLIQIRDIVSGWYRGQALCGDTKNGRLRSHWKNFEIKSGKNSHVLLSILGMAKLQVLPIYKNTQAKIFFQGKMVKSIKVTGEAGYNTELPTGTYRVEMWDGTLLQETRVITLRPTVDYVISHR